MVANPLTHGDGLERYEPWEMIAVFCLLGEDYKAGWITLAELRSIVWDLLFREGRGELWTVGVKSGK